MLQNVRNPIADFVFRRTLKRHQSRLGHRAAPQYSAYLRECQRKYVQPAQQLPAEAAAASQSFRRDGFAAYSLPENRALAASMLRSIQAREAAGEPVWDADGVYRGDAYLDFPELRAMLRGNLTPFLESLYDAHVKIFYAKIYKSTHDAAGPSGSQLWHADSGPGTCTNVMVYLSEGTAENGAMEVIPWETALRIMESERASLRALLPVKERAMARVLSRMEQRALLSEWYRERIGSAFAGAVQQPTGEPGMILAFRNNTLHKGGYPQPGHTRYVIVLHIYPADRPMPYDTYAQTGITKKSAYPLDPAF